MEHSNLTLIDQLQLKISNMEEINVKNILDWLTDMVKSKQMLDAHTWVSTAQKLNILIGDEHDKLFELERQVAQAKIVYLNDNKSVSESKLRIETTILYTEMQKQRSIIKQVEEMIRIAKLQARLKDSEYRQQ